MIVMYRGRVMEELAAADLARRAPPLHPRPPQLPAEDRRRPRPAARSSTATPPGRSRPMSRSRSTISRSPSAQGRREVRAVRDVSFTVEERESFGLVGESGSGKSTILRAICGLAPVSGGEIRIGGRPLPRAPRPSLRPPGADGLPGPLRLAAPQAHRRRHPRRAARHPRHPRPRRPRAQGPRRRRPRPALPLPLPPPALRRPAPARRRSPAR